MAGCGCDTSDNVNGVEGCAGSGYCYQKVPLLASIACQQIPFCYGGMDPNDIASVDIQAFAALTDNAGPVYTATIAVPSVQLDLTDTSNGVFKFLASDVLSAADWPHLESRFVQFILTDADGCQTAAITEVCISRLPDTAVELVVVV